MMNIKKSIHFNSIIMIMKNYINLILYSANFILNVIHVIYLNFITFIYSQ